MGEESAKTREAQAFGARHAETVNFSLCLLIQPLPPLGVYFYCNFVVIYLDRTVFPLGFLFFHFCPTVKLIQFYSVHCYTIDSRCCCQLSWTAPLRTVTL